MSSSHAGGAGSTIDNTEIGRLVRLGAATILYFVLARLAATAFMPAEGLPTILPSAGLLLGWILLSGRREWPLIGALALVARALASTGLFNAPLAAGGLALGEVAGTLACAVVLIAVTSPARFDLRDSKLLARFMLTALLVGGPVFAVTSSLTATGARSTELLVTRGLAYFLGVITVAPIVLTAGEALEWLRDSTWRSRLELATALALIVAMLLPSYISPVDDVEGVRWVNVVMVLPFLWAGMRFGSFAAAWAAALVTLAVASAGARDVGLYATLAGSEYRHFMYGATYSSVAAILALSNASIVSGLRRALSTLESTERWFRELANASPLAMLAIEPDQQTMFFNKALIDLYGYHPKEIATVDAFWRRVMPDLDERNSVTREWYARVAESRRLGTPVRPLEWRGTAADGSYRYVEAHGSEIGERRLILLVDRTADREAKAARRAGEQLFRQLIDSAPIAIMVIESDHESLRLNRTFTELLGWDATDMPNVATYLEKVFPDPVYRKKMDDTWKKRLAEWRSKEGPFRPVTARFQCKDGSVVFLEVRTASVGDRRINTLMDLTERQRTEAALRASETQFRAMFDSSAIAISLVDLSGRPMKTNRALTNLLGYSEQELCSRSWMSITHPEDIESDVSLFNELIAGGRDAYQVEKRYIRKDRGVVFVRVTLSLIRDARGAPTFYVSMVEDITKRTELEGALRQAQKMEAVGQLTSGISHDFNNLLSIIIGNIELVMTQLGRESGPVERELSDASEAAQRGAEMIRKLLGFSRQAELRKEPVNLSAVVSGFVRMLRRLLPSDIDISIVLDPSADSLTVRADVGAVEQIIVNLATNARDAMPRGGQLQLTVGRGEISGDVRAAHPWLTQGEYVSLAVSDTGTGMDSGTLAMVFEPFFTTKGEGKGTGLGMAMIDGLAKQHEGFVEVESHVGKGTTVRVWFPVVPEGAWEFDAKIPDAGEIRGGTETILLAEDKEALRRVTKRLLEGLGYTIIPAGDGAQALKLFNRNRDRIDLVVTDMVMPKLHGHELYRAVRDTGADVPFVFASGYSPAELRSRAALGEDVRHLPKPVTLETLAKAIREALNPLGRRPPDGSLQESAPDR